MKAEGNGRRRHTAASLGVLASLVFFPIAAGAQRGDASIEIRVSEDVVAVGQTFVVEIEARNEGGGLTQLMLPSFEGLSTQSRQVEHQSINGRTSITHRFQVFADAPGALTIEPASVRAGMRTIRSNAVTIKVADGPRRDDDEPDSSAATTSPGGDAASFDSTAFVRTVVDNPNPWVGQQVTVTVYFYTRLGGQMRLDQSPSTDGFWVQDLIDPTTRVPEQTVEVRGVRFRAHLIRRFAAFPQRAGALTIGPAALTIQGNVSMFGRSPDIERVGVPLTVNARALPPGGRGTPIVGRFTAEATLDPATVRTGEAATVTLVVRGTGNLRDARVSFPSIQGLRADPPDVTDVDQTARDLIAGERRFKWLVVAEQGGRYTIPDFAVAAFDPTSGEHSVLHTTPLALEAIGSAAPLAPDEPEEEEAGEEEATEDRALAVRGASELLRASPRLSDSPFYPYAVAFPPIALLAYLLGTALRHGVVRRRTAIRGDRRREARKLLTAARTHAKAGDVAAFYAAVARALSEIIEARVAAPIGSMTHGELRAFLGARGMDDDLARRVVDELEGSDFARFSSAGSSPEELDRALERAEALILRIERFTPKELAA
jgi:hypothetical protein